MAVGAAGQCVGADSITYAGGADCGKLDQPAAAVGYCFARCQAIAGGTGKVL